MPYELAKVATEQRQDNISNISFKSKVKVLFVTATDKTHITLDILLNCKLHNIHFYKLHTRHVYMYIPRNSHTQLIFTTTLNGKYTKGLNT